MLSWASLPSWLSSVPAPMYALPLLSLIRSRSIGCSWAQMLIRGTHGVRERSNEWRIGEMMIKGHHYPFNVGIVCFLIKGACHGEDVIYYILITTLKSTYAHTRTHTRTRIHTNTHSHTQEVQAVCCLARGHPSSATLERAYTRCALQEEGVRWTGCGCWTL